MLKIKNLSFLAVVGLLSVTSSLFGAPGDFTVGTNTGTNNANSWPTGEPPTALFDNNQATKYLNFGKEFTGVALTLATGVVVDGISFRSANDGPERNPATFSLYGSNSVVVTGTEGANTVPFTLSAFTPITLNQATGFSTTTGQFTLSEVDFQNTTSYTTYLLVFPTIANSSTANSMQLAEAMLTSGVTPVVNNTAKVVGGELQPVPEPSVFGLAAVSMVGLMAFRRRR